jgi:hypothetical protein
MILDTNRSRRGPMARQHGLPVLSNDSHFDVVSGIQRIAF